MTTLPSGLPVVVDRAGEAPLAVQVSAQLRAAVTGGVLRSGDRLPSSRDLAATLGVSRTVVTNAYARLFAEGWLEGRHGSGTYVADVRPAALPQPDGREIDTRALSVTGKPAALAAARRPDTMAPLAIGPPGEDLGGYGGSSPREITDLQPGISWAEGIDPAAWRRAWRQ